MSSFSIGDAAVEGFRVTRERWRVLVGWAGFNLLALTGSLVVMVVLLLMVTPFVGSAEAAGQAGGVIGGIVVGLGSLFVQVVIITGLYRIMLRPDAPGFLHLRIGADEMRVLGAVLLIVLASIPLIFAVGLAMMLIGGWAGGLAGLVLIGLFYALILRIALAPVIAFAERRIDLVEAWRRTRGQTWRLVGLAVLLLCLVAVIAVVAWLAVFFVGGLLTGFRDLGLSGRETMAAHPGRYLFQFLAELLLAPFFLVISQAPWVAVYRSLSEPA